MEWFEEVKAKQKRKNKVLFSKESSCLQELSWLLTRQNRRVVVLWGMELASQGVQVLTNRYPEDLRPEQMIKLCSMWSEGKIKMPQAKQAILQVHAMAKELNSPEEIALCHAAAQGCSVIHTPGHALGYSIYELTALVHRYGIEHCIQPMEKRCEEYVQRLLFWEQQEPTLQREWASFLR